MIDEAGHTVVYRLAVGEKELRKQELGMAATVQPPIFRLD